MGSRAKLGDGWVIADSQLRPLLCTTTAECEAARSDLPGVPERVVCLNGMCQFPDNPLGPRDVFALCLFDEPRWPDFATYRDDPRFVELTAIVRDVCASGTCVVPLDCRQP